MTHQYESEVLNKLMERDGINIPSSVPPYEAEIKDYLINQVKQAYPKLTDYEAEWLLYNYTKHLPADFPISSVSNVTEASFENVVPFAYQSAILKGNTLVNLIKVCNVQITSNSSKSLEYVYGGLDTSKSYLLQYRVNQLPELTNTSDSGRVLKFEWYNSNTSKSHLNVYNKDIVVGKNNTRIIEPYTDSVTRTTFGVYCPNYASGILDIDIIIIEYHQGMENWDIPYFDGMQSVKMPVLTTSNEDSTKTNILTVNEEVTLRSNGSVCDELDLLTGKLTQRIDEDGSVLTQEVVKTVDLITINENGETTYFMPLEGSMSVSSSSETIQPTFDMSVPVEATTQNLSSFIDLEMEE